MKNFTLTDIYLTDDGRVILSGPSGSLDICLPTEKGYAPTASIYRVRYDQTHEENVETNTHHVTIEALTAGRKRSASVIGQSF